ncbi:MAG: InlB B-repeat-containing protein, partial [Lachnospiraceae bacterium]|nr:InlB B-repeat-containing protein [Lachnospiraceae bacterium]
MRQRKDIRRRKKSFWAGLLAVVLFLHTMPMTVLAESIDLGMIEDESIDLSGYVGKILAPGETISWQTKNVDPWYSNGSETYICYDMGDGTTSDGVWVSAVVTKGTGTAVNDEFTYTHTIKPVSDFGFYSSLSDDQKAVTGWIIKESSSLDVVGGSAGVSINTITLTACYDITWVDGNGVTLKTDTVAYGVTPSYSGSTPTKTATAQYTYTFNDTWSPAVTEVTGAATYTAQFDQTGNSYTVTFDANGHGTAPAAQTPVAYGAKATTPTAPTETGYTFGGWYREAVCTNEWKFDTDTVTEDTTLYAKWTINKYNVTFVDEDETTVLKAATAYDYGTAAADIVQPTTTPTKAATAEYTYSFAGWTPAIADVGAADQTYKATYSATVNQYTITWKDGNG